MRYGDEELAAAIVGKTITRIQWSEDTVVFDVLNGPPVTYYVDGDCCSNSYLFDFYGVTRLLASRPVTAFESVELAPGDPGYLPDGYEEDYECIQVYGYRFTTVDPKFGEVSSVLSFRNSSNGYYGGEMHVSVGDETPEYGGVYGRQATSVELREITEDVIG